MIPLCVPNISGNEGKYLARCVETTFVSSVGEYVDQFEASVARATGSAFAVATSSGTSGLHSALYASGVGPGDHVIIPALTFIATANAVAQCYAVPVIVDVSQDNWCLDPDLVRDLLENRCDRDAEGILRLRETGGAIRAIMPVCAMGLPADMDAFRDIADTYRLVLIADAAAAIGATYRGRPIGQAGADLSVVSFNGNKLVTCGGGGAIVGQDLEAGRRLKHLTTTARVGRDYDHDIAGFNYRMTNLQAAVGVAQMERLDEFLEAKSRIAATYEQAFCDLQGVHAFPVAGWAKSSHWLTGLYLPELSLERVAELRGSLMANGIEARSFWKPIHMQAPYSCAPTHLNGKAEALWERILPLPCSSHLTAIEQRAVITVVTRFFAC